MASRKKADTHGFLISTANHRRNIPIIKMPLRILFHHFWANRNISPQPAPSPDKSGYIKELKLTDLWLKIDVTFYLTRCCIIQKNQLKVSHPDSSGFHNFAFCILIFAFSNWPSVSLSKRSYDRNRGMPTVPINRDYLR
jgi:hypothetical protein